MAGDVTFSGPFFDGRVPDLMRQMTNDMEDEIARRGGDLVKDAINDVIRHPSSPDYGGRRIRTERRGDGAVIFDSNAVYGAWLEGTGTRNSPVTRFPGYGTFRRSVQFIQMNADEWAQPIVERYVEEMNE